MNKDIETFEPLLEPGKKNVTGYLKWADVTIGEIINSDEVIFVDYSVDEISAKAVDAIVKGAKAWDRNRYTDFLTDRIISRSRRDIEKILFRIGLTEYDAIKIAEKTHALNPKDLFWISPVNGKGMTKTMSNAFNNIFKMKIDADGSTEHSPDGQNIKRYGVDRGKYGILKKRLSSVMTDAESEVAVYKFAVLMGIPACPAWFVDKDTVFSQFSYDFTSEYLVHARHFFKDGERTGEHYKDFVKKFPDFKIDMARMCLIDFVTRQDDRHLSNFAVLITKEGNKFYPLYDNGRSLFFEDTPEIVADAISDIPLYSTSFGEVGTYYDVIEDIAREFPLSKLINLDITENQIIQVLEDSRFKDYRFEGSLKWVTEAIRVLKSLNNY